MIIRCFVLIESIGSQIQHAVIKPLILQNLPIRSCHRLGCVSNTAFYEHLIIEITLVYLPHIDQAKYDQGTDQPRSTKFFGLKQQQTDRSERDDPERTPAVGSENSLSYLFEIGQHRVQILCGNVLHRCHFG